MSAWYNENDPFAADWLEQLMEARLIAPGVVDRRSIRDVKAADLAGYDQHHFFAGIGGWSYSLRLAGWPDDRPVWTGSCPCQPFSAAGKRKGFADDRHLWPVWRDIVEERRPPVVFGEQVASAAQWLRLVRGDLEALGYAVGAIPVEAASAGADHLRNRFWFVADRDGARPQGRLAERQRADQWPVGQDGVEYASGGRCGNTQEALRAGRSSTVTASEHEWVIGADGKARRVKPGIRLLVDGFPNRVGLLRGFGNAIDPRPARQIIEAFMELDR